jgi:type II secretory pathway pseudopilin PulG
VELLFGLVLSLTAAVVGVWHVASRDRPIHGPRDDGTLGLPHLQHWSERQKRPRFENVRRNLPLIEISRLVVVVVVFVILAGAVFFGYGYWSSRELRSQQEVNAKLGEVVIDHARANSATDTQTAFDLLKAAEQDIDTLIARSDESVLSEDVFAELESIQNDIRALTKQRELDSIQLLGSVPDVTPDTPVRLIQGGGHVYLLAGALYEVDSARSNLVKLLEPGDTVDGAEVGTLLAASWREDGPLVVDSGAAFVFDVGTGQWMREPLGKPEAGGAPDLQAIDAFDFNLYALDTASGSILKYTGGDYAGIPENWTEGLDVPEMTTALDVAVDGSIYLLLDDGRILSLYLNAVDQFLEPSILPRFPSATGLSFGSEKDYLYLLSEDGRIARITREGVLIQQFTAPEEIADFTGLRELVVDEVSGIAYALVENRLYAIRIPDAPNTDDQQ